MEGASTCQRVNATSNNNNYCRKARDGLAGVHAVYYRTGVPAYRYTAGPVFYSRSRDERKPQKKKKRSFIFTFTL